MKRKHETRPRFIIQNDKHHIQRTSNNGAKIVKDKKRIKFNLSIAKDAKDGHLHSTAGSLHSRSEKKKKPKDIKQTQRRRDGYFHCGRWTLDEHQRFIEAILKYGNEWKMVQKQVGTRSSSQARSHAQKFFVKIKNANLFDFNVDFNKTSIKSLHRLATNLTEGEYMNTLKALNEVGFEQKTRRKLQKADNPFSTHTFMNDLSTINSMTWR
jgi:SHAQKYF class myb-like DNA-binding protein